MNELKTSDAVVAGQAERIPAALKAQQPVLTAQIQIIRAGTGKVENYTLTGTPESDEQPKEDQ